jgi:hypothetical protein
MRYDVEQVAVFFLRHKFHQLIYGLIEAFHTEQLSLKVDQFCCNFFKVFVAGLG